MTVPAVDARDKMGRTALYRAARKGDTDQVKQLVAHGADIHAVTENGKSVLSASARSGDTAAIDFLLSRGADVNAVDEDNRSVLYHAARKGQLESMRLLVQRGANLHAATDNKVTVLHAAAYSSDNAAALEFVLDCGADINATTERGSTALHVAVGEGHVECMKLLVQRGADIHATTKEGKTVLHVAAERNEDADMMAYLVDGGVDINAADENGSTALHYSARRGHVECMTFLIQHNADIHATTADGRTVLHAAVGSSGGDIETLKYLIDHGVDINAMDEDGWTALVEAVRGGHTESMKLLIQRGADIHATTESKRTILHWAAERSDDIATLQYLLDHHVDINAVDEDGWTALSYAVSEGHLKSMKLLIQRGADIHAITKDGRTFLHAAAAGRDDAVPLEYLIEGGADVNAVDEDGRTPLHDAASNGHAECMRFLIQRGANIRVITKDGRTVLQEAAAGVDDAVALGYLIDGGADINAADEDGRTALYDAACNGHVECMRFLIQRGADIHATTKDGETLLLAAAFSRNPIAVRLMVEVGLAIDAVDNEGDTALHYLVCHNGDVATMQLLVESGADIHAINAKGQSVLHSAVEGCELKATKYLIGQGLNVNATDAGGRTTLHYAAQQGGLAVLPYLVAQGGNIHALTKHRMGLLHFAVQGADLHVLDYVLKLGVDINPPVENIDGWMSPLALAICAVDHQDSYKIASKLCSRGASLSEHDLRQLKSGIIPMIANDSEKASSNEDEIHQQWREGLCACVDFWVQQRLDGVERLPHIPREVVKRGHASVKTYLADIARSSRDELINRCKVCVVGPSEWGKTSLVQSITIEKPILIERKDRTIGIDLTETVLSGDDGSQHEVTFWDFAGQDMYQAAHTLFFSRRTLFVLVVDLEAYSKELQLAETETSQENELQMNRFVRSHVFKWVRAIFAQQPDARFLVVGTKANLLEDPDLVEDVWDDLKDRLKEWKADFVKGMEKQISSKDSRSKEVKDLKSKLAQIASDDWLVAKLTSVDSIAEVRAALQQTLAANDLGFPMWKMYRKVLQAVLKRREAARRAGTARERIEQSIVRFRTLRKQLLQEIDDLKRDECEQILRTLNDLGDVLWYEHNSAGVFKDHLVLDPMLVIDVVREVVRHDMSASSGMDVAGDGGVPHALLKTFPLWRDMDMELMHAMKELLQHFQLAYPADADAMLPESDLIVPAYWQLIKAASTAPRALAPSQAVCDAFVTHRWCWEYEVPGELAETIFEKFAVQSHSSSMPRTIRGFCMEAACSEFATSISLRLGHTSRDIVRIEVSGETEELSWHNMRFYLMKMEKVLDAYRGDVVWRYIVYRDYETGQEKRASVGSVVKLLEDTIVMGRDIDALRVKTPWMPPDMDWFMHKSWNDITTFQQLQMNELVRNKLQVLEKLAIAGDAPRQFPALWSLQYLPEEHKAIVRMHSDLSGRCYHVPIEIDTGSPLLARHASVFKMGLSLCATVVESALSFPIVQAVVDAAKSALEAQADHAARVHNLIDKLDLSARSDLVDTRSTGLSPGASMVLLRDLLNVHNDGLDDLEISELSNLECAVTERGEYVWAHAHEITAMNGKITRCHAPPSTWAALEEQEPEPSPAQTHSTANAIQPSGEFKLALCVESIDGLADWDWHKTYCKWQLYHGKSRVPIASDVTPLHADSSSPPSWHAMKVAVDSVTSVAMLRACRLAVQVKRRSRIGWTKLIDVGEISLVDFVDQDAEVHFRCERIRVPLEVATRCVVIQLTA